MRTVAANTARLTVYRNGTALFTHDDASHFIADGQPGLGLFATTAISLDDWRGGEAAGAPGAVTPFASSAQDDFNRRGRLPSARTGRWIRCSAAAPR